MRVANTILGFLCRYSAFFIAAVGDINSNGKQENGNISALRMRKRADFIGEITCFFYLSCLEKKSKGALKILLHRPAKYCKNCQVRVNKVRFAEMLLFLDCCFSSIKILKLEWIPLTENLWKSGSSILITLAKMGRHDF